MSDNEKNVERHRFVVEPDVIVVVGGREFQESSHALRLWSEYFDAAFRSGMKESQTMRFEFPDKKPEDWELIMSLLLEPFSKAKLTEDNVYTALSWFDELCVHRGLEECDTLLHDMTCTNIRSKMHMEDVLSHLSKSLRANLPKTKKLCFTLLKDCIKMGPAWLTKEDLDSTFALVVDNHDCREALWGAMQAYLPSKVTDHGEQDLLIRAGIIQRCILARAKKRETTKELNKTRKALDDSHDVEPNGNNTACFPFWQLDVPDDQEKKVSTEVLNYSSFNFHPDGPSKPTGIRYPITSELPHVILPVGRHGQASIEGLLDTGGACTMGDLVYWREVANRNPHLIIKFKQLTEHQVKPIAIGGVGQGKVEITHVMEFWLPWIVNNNDSKLVVGLGENMPVTLLIGLPFIISAECTLDFGNLKCYSSVFDDTWKLTLKMPRKKTLHSLDASTVSTGKRVSFPALTAPSTKRSKVSDAASIDRQA